MQITGENIKINKKKVVLYDLPKPNFCAFPKVILSLKHNGVSFQQNVEKGHVLEKVKSYFPLFYEHWYFYCLQHHLAQHK